MNDIVALLPFSYRVSFPSIAPDGVTPGSAIGMFTIEADGDFLLETQVFQCDAENFGAGFIESTTFDNQRIPELFVELEDIGSGRKWQNSPVPLANVFGSGGLPYIVPFNRIWYASQKILVNVSWLPGIDATSIRGLELVFQGQKILRSGA